MTEVKEKKKGKAVKKDEAVVTKVGARVASAATSSETLDAFVGQKVAIGLVLTDLVAGSFAWEKDGAPIDGATGPVLVIAEAADADAGEYKCKVTPIGGGAEVESTACTLTVSAAIDDVVKEYDVAINEFHGAGFTHTHWQMVDKLVAIVDATNVGDKFSEKFKDAIATDKSLYTLHCAFVASGGHLVITDSRDGYQFEFKSDTNKDSIVKHGPMVDFWK